MLKTFFICLLFQVVPGAFWKTHIGSYICTCLIPETLSHKMEQAFGDLEEYLLQDQGSGYTKKNHATSGEGNADSGWM